MIRHDQIPMDVRRAMRAAWARRNNSDSVDKLMTDLAVAMLAAWPDVEMRPTFNPTRIILPLPQVGGDT